MSDEIKNNEVLIEEDKDYDELLGKFENPKESASSSKKKNSHIKALIICIIAVVVLVGAGALLIFAPKGEPESKSSGGAAQVKTEIGKDKVRELKVKTDSNGKITQNGSGELVGKVPADVTEIKIKNSKGSYTLLSYTPKKKTKETDPDTGKTKYKTEETQYTLKGYENFKLQDGIPDEVANSCSTMEFKSVISENAGSNLSDFGLDKPRAVATVTFEDGTKAIIKVGADAAQQLGTYVMYGSNKTVYLCASEQPSKLLYGVTDFISKEINKSISDEGSAEFSRLTLSGTHFKNNIVLKPNSDTKHISNTHIITSPYSDFADDTEASQVQGAIRGLNAESVAAVKPNSGTIAKYGLSNPYAKLDAVYSDATVRLIASKPDSKGNCYLMKTGGNVIYKIGRASIPWIDTTAEKLLTKYVFKPELSSLKQMSVTLSKKTYDFDIKTTVTTSKDENGEETSSSDTRTKYNGNEIEEGNFETYFGNANLITKADNSSKNASGSPALTIKYTYESGRKPDTVSFYKSGTKYIAVVNSKTVGTVISTYVEKLIDQTPEVAQDKEVKTFW